ncbi:hypothetical protein V1524DRAFT_33741 [Lipomyces starkeyi]
MDVRKNMALLAGIFSIATQEVISRDKHRFLGRAARDVVESIPRSDCLHVQPPWNCRPAWGYWQFTMEKTCGNVVTWLQGRKLKDENLPNAILLNEQINLLCWINPNACLSLGGILSASEN